MNLLNSAWAPLQARVLCSAQCDVTSSAHKRVYSEQIPVATEFEDSPRIFKEPH